MHHCIQRQHLDRLDKVGIVKWLKLKYTHNLKYTKDKLKS